MREVCSCDSRAKPLSQLTRRFSRAQTLLVTIVCTVCFMLRAAAVVLLALAAFKNWKAYDDVRASRLFCCSRCCH